MTRREEDNLDATLRRVVTRMIRRGIRLAGRKGRIITLARSAAASPIDIRRLDPSTPEGAARLEKFLRGKTNSYIFSGLGKLSEKNRIHWTALNRPVWKRVAITIIMMGAMALRASRLKNRIYRMTGVSLGKNSEIMQAAWLDHFCPELIAIGDGSMVGAFCKLSTHAYEGGGTFRVGLVRIGHRCVLASGVSLAAIRIGDDVRVLPNTTLSPYFARIHPKSVVGGEPPQASRAPGTTGGEKPTAGISKEKKNSFDSSSII